MHRRWIPPMKRSPPMSYRASRWTQPANPPACSYSISPSILRGSECRRSHVRLFTDQRTRRGHVLALSFDGRKQELAMSTFIRTVLVAVFVSFAAAASIVGVAHAAAAHGTGGGAGRS